MVNPEHVWAVIGAAVVGTGLYVQVPHWVRALRVANRRVNADIAFLQSLPAGVEEKNR